MKTTTRFCTSTLLCAAAMSDEECADLFGADHPICQPFSKDDVKRIKRMRVPDWIQNLRRQKGQKK